MPNILERLPKDVSGALHRIAAWNSQDFETMQIDFEKCNNVEYRRNLKLIVQWPVSIVAPSMNTVKYVFTRHFPRVRHCEY